MWEIIKWTFRIIVWTLVAAFLWYTLPRNDVVRITDTYVQRVHPGDNSIFWAHSNTGDATTTDGYDVQFISAVKANGKPMVYRNEDTGWGWPPYFKFDTSSLQSIAADNKSTGNDEKWVAVKKYGWRLPFLSVYPNAISVTPVAGPDVRVIPWIAITLLVILGCIWLAIWSRWRKFRARRIDPLLDDE
ncbi:DUF1523 family protein [Tropicimonas sp. IMCC34043]|uniref:DUF1523 family protein n=1 Tax=Tropicimonas sp. IMCC34043 TaxID=2248760 RepID=UPI000E274266|nr:DUF1523 family protein [Tropicimonas sp. IMCC34043]